MVYVCVDCGLGAGLGSGLRRIDLGAWLVICMQDQRSRRMHAACCMSLTPTLTVRAINVQEEGGVTEERIERDVPGRAALRRVS
jgi:hypothetical protein